MPWKVLEINNMLLPCEFIFSSDTTA